MLCSSSCVALCCVAIHVVFLSFPRCVALCCVALCCVAICCVYRSCLFPVVLRCGVLCCDLLLYPLDIFLLSFTFVPPQDGTTRPTDNGFTSATSSTNATTLSTTSIVCSPNPNTLFFCLVFAMPTVLQISPCLLDLTIRHL